MNKNEFDQYSHDYNNILDHCLSCSGESSAYFSEIKAIKLKEWLPQYNNKPIRILDFGCGTGTVTQSVCNNFPKAQIIDIDPSVESIKKAKKRNMGASFFCMKNKSIEEFELNPINSFVRYVFKRIPFDQDATMMNHCYSRKLLQKYGKTALYFYCFFPKPLCFLRPMEKYLNKISTWYTLWVCSLQEVAHFISPSL